METFENLNERNAFVEKMRKRFDTQQKDSEALKPAKIEMDKAIGDFTKMPRKIANIGVPGLNVISGPGKQSVRSDKTNENKLHGLPTNIIKEEV